MDDKADDDYYDNNEIVVVDGELWMVQVVDDFVCFYYYARYERFVLNRVVCKWVFIFIKSFQDDCNSGFRFYSVQLFACVCFLLFRQLITAQQHLFLLHTIFVFD